MDIYKRLGIAVLPSLIIMCLAYVVPEIITTTGGDVNSKVAFGFVLAFALLTICIAIGTISMAYEEFSLDFRILLVNIAIIISALMFLIGSSIMIHIANNIFTATTNTLKTAAIINIVATFLAVPSAAAAGYSIAIERK